MQIYNLEQLDFTELEQMRQAEKDEKSEKLYHRFNSRFSNDKPFLVKHKETRALSGRLSWLFNIVSLIGLLWAVKELLSIIPIPYANWIIAIPLLIGFEILKRRYSDKFWDYYWMSKKSIHWMYGFINFILLFGISMGGSLYGMYFVTTDNAPEKKVLGMSDDPAAVAFQERITAIDKELDYHYNNKNNKGIVFWPSQKSIESLSEERASIAETLQSKYGIYEIQNQGILSEWQIKRNFRAGFAIILTFLFEILFEACMRFNSRYDYYYYLARMKSLQQSMDGQKKSGGIALMPS